MSRAPDATDVPVGTEHAFPPPSVKASARLQALRSAIVDIILSRNLRPGDPMPTESELMTQLGVGRNTLREALKALQAAGVVDVRHGYGTQVGTGGLDALIEGLTFRGRLSLRQDRRAARELVQVREAMEVGLVPLTIELSMPRDLARVREVVEAMEASAALGRTFPELDNQFHRLLYGPLENALLSELLDAFWVVYQQVRADLGEPTVDVGRTAADHRVIYEAVAARDTAAATDAVRSHFLGIHARLAEDVTDGAQGRHTTARRRS